MREIKFRAWDGVRMNYSKDWSSLSAFFNDHGHNKLMQYTGLKDRNGIEIYEGDICQQTTNNIEIITEVKFRYGCFFLCNSDDTGEIMNEGAGDFHYIINEYKSRGLKIFVQLEVIGNVHENTELLKVKDKQL